MTNLVENYTGLWLGSDAFWKRGNSFTYQKRSFTVPFPEVHEYKPSMRLPEQSEPATEYIYREVEQPGQHTRDLIRVWVEAHRDDQWIWNEYLALIKK